MGPFFDLRILMMYLEASGLVLSDLLAQVKS